MFWPSRLGILYPHPGSALPTWQVIAAVCMLLLISIAVILAGRRLKYLFVGWFWFIGTLVPVIGLVQVGLQALADRYTYVPLIGLFIIIAWSAAEIFGKLKYKTAVLSIAAIVILFTLSTLTWLQVGYWQNSFTLFEHTVAVTTNNDLMHYNLGSMYLREGKTDEAIKHYSESVKIKPDQPTIHNNLAILYGRQGKFDKALESYREVLKYRPDDKIASDAIKAIEKMQNSSPTP
jgi:tetratricopeptide (TPR) repeat protein